MKEYTGEPTVTAFKKWWELNGKPTEVRMSKNVSIPFTVSIERFYSGKSGVGESFKGITVYPEKENLHKTMEKVITFIDPKEIEPEALQQIENTSRLPFLFRHVAVMPDCHFGKGATVGTVLPTKGAIVPAAVGVDIGCGMIAVKTPLHKEDMKDLPKLRASIERSIPMSAGRFNNVVSKSAAERIRSLEDMAVENEAGVVHYNGISPNWRNQLGTLGGGNHFVEICLDENDIVWLTLHSGSRGIGNKIGNMYIEKAQKLCDSMFIELADRDLAYLPEGSKDFNDYLRDLHWAQKFALFNRDEMMDRVLKDVSYHVYGEGGHEQELEVERINSHHNFSQIENHYGHNVWITRKGAIEASVGKKAMIPGSMGTRSYIVSGLGKRESFNSAPHGAGRRFSRGEARKRFTMKDFDEAMQGIEHRREDVLLDEIPAAYKDIDQVMENANELVKVEATLHQIINMKGD